MKQSTNILLALAATAGISNAALTVHSSMDNVDVGAGFGTDTTSSGAFNVGNSVGTDGTAENVIDGGATGSAHVTSGHTGQVGQALSFDRTGTSSNRAVGYGTGFDPGTSDVTVSLWFNISNTTGIEMLASEGNAGSTTAGWSIFAEGSSLRVRMAGDGANNRGSQSISITGLADEWHHVAFVIDNSAGTITGYLDGTNTGWTSGGGGPGAGDNTITAGSSLANASELRLGIAANGTAEFQGELDEFRLYNEALTAPQIAALAAVPEPSSAALLGLGGVALLFRRRK